MNDTLEANYGEETSRKRCITINVSPCDGIICSRTANDGAVSDEMENAPKTQINARIPILSSTSWLAMLTDNKPPPLAILVEVWICCPQLALTRKSTGFGLNDLSLWREWCVCRRLLSFYLYLWRCTCHMTLIKVYALCVLMLE